MRLWLKVMIYTVVLLSNTRLLSCSISKKKLGCNAQLIVDEFGEKLLEELDYLQEARNIQVQHGQTLHFVCTVSRVSLCNNQVNHIMQYHAVRTKPLFPSAKLTMLSLLGMILGDTSHKCNSASSIMLAFPAQSCNFCCCASGCRLLFFPVNVTSVLVLEFFMHRSYCRWAVETCAEVYLCIMTKLSNHAL